MTHLVTIFSNGTTLRCVSDLQGKCTCIQNSHEYSVKPTLEIECECAEVPV